MRRRQQVARAAALCGFEHPFPLPLEHRLCADIFQRPASKSASRDLFIFRSLAAGAAAVHACPCLCASAIVVSLPRERLGRGMHFAASGSLARSEKLKKKKKLKKRRWTRFAERKPASLPEWRRVLRQLAGSSGWPWSVAKADADAKADAKPRSMSMSARNLSTSRPVVANEPAIAQTTANKPMIKRNHDLFLAYSLAQ